MDAFVPRLLREKTNNKILMLEVQIVTKKSFKIA